MGFQRLDHESFIWQEERFPSPVMNVSAFQWLWVMLAQMLDTDNKKGIFS